MTGAMGGTFKLTLAVVIAWAWLSGRLERRIGEVLDVFAGSAARGNRTLPRADAAAPATSSSGTWT